MISFNVKQWRSEDQTKLDQFVPDPCACTCHRTDVKDDKMRAVCMTCTCAFETPLQRFRLNLWGGTRADDILKEKRKEAKEKRKE